jgi:hypothetical protein
MMHLIHVLQRKSRQATSAANSMRSNRPRHHNYPRLGDGATDSEDSQQEDVEAANRKLAADRAPPAANPAPSTSFARAIPCVQPTVCGCEAS